MRLALLTVAATTACAGSPSRGSTDAEGLAGTAWQLVVFESSDDTVLTPDERSKYTLQFTEDGSVAVRADCNRGRGTWKATPEGQLEIGPLALTRALCPPSPLEKRFARDLGFVRSYIRRNGRLHLALMADAGIYTFEPLAEARVGE